MNDDHTINEAMVLVKRFCEERDWDQFHNPKDLAIGISTEASELLELMRFKTPSECEQALSDAQFKGKICNELADVFYFVLRFAQMNDIDLYNALEKKIKNNEEKYPAGKCKGCNKKYDEYP